MTLCVCVVHMYSADLCSYAVFYAFSYTRLYDVAYAFSYVLSTHCLHVCYELLSGVLSVDAICVVLRCYC